MERYKNLSGQSGVLGYELGLDSITVYFTAGTHRQYVYNSYKPGAQNVAELKRLAVAGSGLNSFITRVIRSNYASRS